MPVSDYGTRKAKRHAQGEANRLGCRLYMQLDDPSADGTRYVHVVRNRLWFPGASFWTFYPEQTAGEDETGQGETGQAPRIGEAITITVRNPDRSETIVSGTLKEVHASWIAYEDETGQRHIVAKSNIRAAGSARR